MPYVLGNLAGLFVTGTLKRAAKNDSFPMKRLESGFVFYITKHATKN
jgi:hypothetical protein